MHTSPFILIITGPAGSGKSTVSANHTITQTVNAIKKIIEKKK